MEELDKSQSSDSQKEKQNTDNKDSSFFKSEPVNNNIQRSMLTPLPSMLWGTLWFEKELALLVGDTAIGKSILGYSIGDGIANGRPDILTFPVTCKPKVVLYFDSELSSKQRELRYTNSDRTRSHDFGPNFIIVEIDRFEIPKGISYEEFYIEKMKEEVHKWKAEVVIIDNITFVCSDLTKGNKAIDLMRLFKNANDELHISTLLLGHVPKRDETLPIGLNDIAGSKNISNALDAAFALNRCIHDKSFRYIKQLKQRMGEENYKEENVVMCKIVKEECFLGFEFIRYDTEDNMLLTKDEAARRKRRQDAQDLRNEGNSYRQIAEKLGVSYVTIKKDIDRMNNN
jgi:predicted ATP-dependent serine protease